MSESLYLLTICLPLATVLVVFGMKYFAAVAQARARRETDASYRHLAEQAVQAQQEAARDLAALRTLLAEVSQRLVLVERILKEVE